MTKYDAKTYNVRPVCYHNNKQNEGGSQLCRTTILKMIAVKFMCI